VYRRDRPLRGDKKPLAVKLSLSIALALLFVSRAVFAIDPSLHWKTLDSKNFSIHFADGNESTARRVAAIAEAVHKSLSPWIGWRPDAQTHVVLSDESDLSNGYASPVPYNRTVLFLTPPRAVSGLEDYDDWLTMLFTHEYLHILHLDKNVGLPASVQNIFGRNTLLFPNLIQPRWFIEGLAVGRETDRDIGVGRGQSSYFRMLMRGEATNGIKPVEQVNQRVRSWPAGVVPYLYGSFFLRFIDETYGEPALNKWIDAYSDNLIPARLNSTARIAVGKTVPELWDEFEDWLLHDLGAEKTITGDSVLVEGERLTEHGFRTQSIDVGTDGSLYYVRDDHLLPPALMKRDPSGVSQELTDLNKGAFIDLEEGGEVLIAQPELCNNTAIYYDLFRYSEDRGLRRLTRCARYVFAHWRPDGEKIAAVHVAQGNSELHLLNTEGGHEETLWRSEAGETLGDFDWSPDGTQLVAAIWRPKVGWNLEQFTLANRQWHAITDSPLIEFSPRYSADGEDIYFSAEYGGVYNIWRYSRSQRQFSQMTNVYSGAFQPVFANDGSLYYLGYHAKGFDIYRLEQPVVIKKRRSLPYVRQMPAPTSERLQSGLAEDYSPLPSLGPRWWLPHLVISDGANEVGIVTGGNDAVERHIYAATLAVDVDNNYPVGEFFYRYRPLNWASFQIYASSVNSVERDEDNEVERIRRRDRFDFSVLFPFLGLSRSVGIVAGVSTDYESDQKTASGVGDLPSLRDNLAGVGLIFANTRLQPLSISRSDGRDVRVAAENSDAFNSDFSGNVYTLDWREFVRLGQSENVLGLRYLRGHGTDDSRPFELGGIRSQSVVDLIAGNVGEPLLNRRQYEFRGYNKNVPGLTGRRMQMISADWRFPISLVERGLMVPPVGLSRVSGRLFVEDAVAWQDDPPDDTFTTAGFELHLDVNALYFDDFRLRAGYAHGFDEVHGGDKFYLTIGGGF
jgi:hypothetical protein